MWTSFKIVQQGFSHLTEKAAKPILDPRQTPREGVVPSHTKVHIVMGSHPSGKGIQILGSERMSNINYAMFFLLYSNYN